MGAGAVTSDRLGPVLAAEDPSEPQVPSCEGRGALGRFLCGREARVGHSTGQCSEHTDGKAAQGAVLQRPAAAPAAVLHHTRAFTHLLGPPSCRAIRCAGLSRACGRIRQGQHGSEPWIIAARHGQLPMTRGEKK